MLDCEYSLKLEPARFPDRKMKTGRPGFQCGAAVHWAVCGGGLEGKIRVQFGTC